MRYAQLNYIWLLWIIPGLFVFYYWAFKHKTALIDKFVAMSLRDRLLKDVSFFKQKFKAVILVCVVAFAIVALLRPQWGFKWEEVHAKGVDIIIAVDISKSMLAQDVSPSRLERAKLAIRDFLDIAQGDRIGLVAFAGTSFLHCPLTLDHGAVELFLDDLNPDLLPIPGTAIGEAINASVKGFDSADKKSRAIILITDGEDQGTDALEMAKKASENGAKIYTVGIGKTQGAPIPDSEAGGFKKDDKTGDLVLSRLDEDVLQKIALNTGGSFVLASGSDMGLDKIYKDIHQELDEKDLQSGRRKRYEDRFQIFLGIAVLLLLAEAFVSERKRSRKQNGPWWFILLLLLILNVPTQDACAFFLTSKAPDAEKSYKKGEYDKAVKSFLESSILAPEDEKLKFNLADSYYKMNNYDEAEKVFTDTSNSSDPKLAEQSVYNLGNTLYRAGKLAEAIEAYKKAIELDPKDEDARYNLEFVKQEMKRQQEEAKKNKTCNNPDDKQKNEDNKDKKENKEDKKNAENTPEEKKQQESQASKEQEKKQQDAQASKEQEKKDAQKSEEQKKASADEQKASDEKKEMNASQTTEVEDKATQMKKQEAMRWLDTLQDDRQQVLKNQMEKNGGPVYRSGKDW